jgi:hypothetical protein
MHDDGKTSWVIEPPRKHHRYFYVFIVAVTIIGVGFGIVVATVIFFGLIIGW